MPKKCSEAALGLISCLEESKCMTEEKRPMKECLQELKKDGNEEICKASRNAYWMCKHSQLNMRTRIRGVRVY